MALPSPPFAGACLCGAVRVLVTAPPLLTLACHCKGCQKLTASAFSMTTMFPAESVTVTGQLVQGAMRDPARDHRYCACCLGFVLSRIATASGRINLRTSVLEAAAALPPFAEVMTEEKLPWVRLPVTRSFARFPENAEALQELMDAYAAQ